MEHMFEHQGSVYTIKAVKVGDHYDFEYKGSVFSVKFSEVGEGMFIADVDGRRAKLIVDGDAKTKHVFFNGDVYQFTRVEKGARSVHKELSGDLNAPLTGRVIKIMTSEGDAVDAKTPLMIIEAMKMEHKIRSPFDGTIDSIPVTEGEMVEGGQLVVKVNKKED